MTKQEEIREGIAEAIAEAQFKLFSQLEEHFWFALDRRIKRHFYKQADKVLSYLHSQGVVIKVDRAKSPDDLVAVEPLIKEG